MTKIDENQIVQAAPHKLRGEGTACFSWQRNRRFSFSWLR